MILNVALPASAFVAFAGSAMILNSLPWFRQRSWTTFIAGRNADRVDTSLQRNIDAFWALMGQRETAAIRLRCIHAGQTVADFRLRQLLIGLAAFAVGIGLSISGIFPGFLSAIFAVGLPALAILIVEDNLTRAMRRWQRTTERQLPVVTEQLALLLASGVGLTSAIERLARRSTGPMGSDLTVVAVRVRQGVELDDALREWAERVDVASVHRLVRVLLMHRVAADLSSLLTHQIELARSSERELLIEQLEKRSQQIWVPVAVATLLPGMILVAIPFVSALDALTSAGG